MHGASKKVRIIVAFGDIAGFTSFCDAVTNDEVEYDPFMAEYDDLIDETARHTGYSFTETGDGFMCTVDLADDEPGARAVEVLLNLWRLLKKIYALIDRRGRSYIVPDGFRIVLASGYVKEKMKRDGTKVLRGKHINIAHKALPIARGHGIVCHASFKHLISDQMLRKHNIRFQPLRESLWIVTSVR